MASMMTTFPLRAAADDKGAELIELALVLPILLLVLAGMVDFGILLQRYEVVTNAAREGARVAVLPNYTVADAQARVSSYLTVSGLTGAAPPANVVYSSETLPSGNTIQLVTVSVEYPSTFLYIGPIAAMVGGSGFGTVTLQAASSMRREVAGGS